MLEMRHDAMITVNRDERCLRADRPAIRLSHLLEDRLLDAKSDQPIKAASQAVHG